jgi:transcriptional regulator with XRE-family HTH domain
MNAEERMARQVGAALRRIREARGVRQGVVADLAGIARRVLSRYERGHARPQLAHLVQVLRALDCDAETFGRYVGPWGVQR